MVVPNNNNSSMSGRKHLLDDHRDMVDYRQVPASVAVPAPVPAPVRAHQGRRLILLHTNPIPLEPTPPEDKSNTGIRSQGRQASAVILDESMAVFFQQANTGGHRPRPIPRMPEGMGIETNSNKA